MTRRLATWLTLLTLVAGPPAFAAPTHTALREGQPGEARKTKPADATTGLEEPDTILAQLHTSLTPPVAPTAAGLEEGPAAIRALIELVFPNGRFAEMGDRIKGPYRLQMAFTNVEGPTGSPRRIHGWVELTKSRQPFTEAEIAAAQQWQFGETYSVLQPDAAHTTLRADLGELLYETFRALPAIRPSSPAALLPRTQPLIVTWMGVLEFSQTYRTWLDAALEPLKARLSPASFPDDPTKRFQEVGIVDITEPSTRMIHLYIGGAPALDDAVREVVQPALQQLGFDVAIAPLPELAPVEFPGVALVQGDNSGLRGRMAVIGLPVGLAAARQFILDGELSPDRIVAAAYEARFATDLSLRPVVVTIQAGDRILTTIWV